MFRTKMHSVRLLLHVQDNYRVTDFRFVGSVVAGRIQVNAEVVSRLYVHRWIVFFSYPRHGYNDVRQQ